MKLLVFAHTPPPHHGQSYMVQLMLEGFGGDRWRPRAPVAGPSPYGIACYHVNARVSRGLADIGGFHFRKVFLLLGYCAQAIWCRYRHGVKILYYVPSPGKRAALMRDWIVLALCRPFYPRIVFHWHAAGLAQWLEGSAQRRIRSLTCRLLKGVDLSIVLSDYNCADAEQLWPKRVVVVHNGTPDPCPDFERQVLPRRLARAGAQRRLLCGQALTAAEQVAAGPLPGLVNVLYLAHCTRDKGLFDAVASVRLANGDLAQRQVPVRLKLRVAGAFVEERERVEFDRLLAEPGAATEIEYLGFVSGPQKHQALVDADLFCFPTFFGNENQPVNLIEAFAYGLPVVTTRWRSVAESLPPGYPGLAEPRHPEQIAVALLEVILAAPQRALREHFLKHFTVERHLANLAQALKQVADP
jgi:glycosyltransferase involved in cell wall biosynthesis